MTIRPQAVGGSTRPARSRPVVTLYGHRLSGPHATGIGRYVHEITQAIASRHDPTVIDYRLSSTTERSALAGTTQMTVRRLPIPRRPLHLSWALCGRPRLDRLVGHPDLVHVLYPSTPVPVKTKLIYTIHDLMPLLHPDWFPRSQRWLFRQALRHAIDRADHLIADSAKTASELHQWMGVTSDRVTVVPLGVAERFFQPVSEEAIQSACRRHGLTVGKYAIVIGATTARKNLKPVIHAMAQLSGQGPTLVAIGPLGGEAEQLKAEVEASNLAGSVHFTGWLPDGDLVALLAGATMLLHPSVDEGFGLPPLEAMAMGVPTVVSSAGSLPEVVGDSAVLVDPHDADGWASAITAVAADSEQRTRLIATGRDRAANFTWQQAADKTIAVHQDCLRA